MSLSLFCLQYELGSISDCTIALLAIITFVFSACQYCQHKKRERVNILTNYNIRYSSDESITKVVQYLESLEDNTAVNRPNIHCMEMFMRFYEELFCLVKSKSLKPNIVYYMFGHYLLVFADNKDKLPTELNYDKDYWRLFRDFVQMMRQAQKELFPDKNEYNLIKDCTINTKKIRL